MKCEKCKGKIEMIDGIDPDIFKYTNDGEFYNRMLCHDCCVYLVFWEDAPQYQKEYMRKIMEKENKPIEDIIADIVTKNIRDMMSMSEEELDEYFSKFDKELKREQKWMEDMS